MGLQNLQLTTNATIAVTGGTAQSFSPDNLEVAGGLHVVDVSVSDFRLRPQITFKAKSPVKKADGSYTKEIRSAKHVVSFLGADGVTQYDWIEVTSSLTPGSVDLAELRKKGAQLCVDTDTDSFYTVGSRA